MLEGNIEKFILNGCMEEVNAYRNINNELNHKTYNKDQWTYIVEIMIITIKSLIPCNSTYGSVIDYSRFNEELKLWYYYRHGGNKSLFKSIFKEETCYWNDSDDSIYSRIPPIVFANEDWVVARNETVKNILFTTGKISTLLEGLALAKLLSVIINIPSISLVDIIKEIKEEIMCFSQKSFIENFKVFFKSSLNEYNGNFTIDFERRRIEMLSVLNGLNGSTEFYILKETLKTLNDTPNKEKVSNFFVGGIYGLITNNVSSISIKDEEFIRNLCAFLVKLRKGRISAENLCIDKYILPDIFQFKEGDVFYHSLLKKSQVIKRIDNKNSIICFVRTKSGTYRFIKDIT